MLFRSDDSNHSINELTGNERAASSRHLAPLGSFFQIMHSASPLGHTMRQEDKVLASALASFFQKAPMNPLARLRAIPTYK